MAEILTWIIVFVIGTFTVAFHVIALNWGHAIFDGNTKFKVFKATALVLLVHVAEIAAFGVLFMIGDHLHNTGAVYNASTIEDYMYFSASNYTSLGYGDLYPVGHLRILAGMEALIGLTMIGWTAAYTFKYISQD